MNTLALLVAAIPAKPQTDPMVQYIIARCAEFGWGRIALLMLASLAVGFVAAWLFSKLLERDTGTLINTVRYYLLGLLSSILIFVIVGVLCGFAIGAGAPGLALIIVILGGLTFLVICFTIPMKVYEIGFLKALVFNIFVLIANSIGQGVLGTVLPGPLDELKGKSTEEQRKIVAQWHMNKRAKELNAQFATPAAAPALTPHQRARQLYAELQQERARLNVNDQGAVLAFNRRVAEYNVLRAQLVPTSAPATATTAPALLPAGRR